MDKGIVIGGGLAGLVSASVLAARGYQMTLLEKQPYLGGKLQPIQLEPYQFELGPSMITMPWMFERVYQETGRKMSPDLRFIPLAISNRNFFADGSTFDLTSDVEFLEEQISQFSVEDQKGLIRYLRDVQQMYRLIESHQFSSPLEDWTSLFDWRYWKTFFSVHPFQSLDRFHQRYFSDPRLRSVFNRYASYMGSSPYQAPAYLSLFSYLELIQGVYYLEGGNYRLIQAYAELAEEMGVAIHTDTEVESILVNQRQEPKGVRTSTNDFLEADFIISTLDEQAVQEQLLHRKPSATPASNSGFLCLLGTGQSYHHIHRHNFFYPSDYGREYLDIFEQEEWPLSPSIYVCNSGYSEPDKANRGSNLHVLLHVPGDQQKMSPLESERLYERYQQMVLYWLEQDWGFHGLSDSLQQSRFIGPRDFAAISGVRQGTLYGRASHGLRSFLPNTEDRKVKRLYYTGGTTHFGSAIVLAVHSGLQIVKKVERDHRS